jgi:hypothetical protein
MADKKITQLAALTGANAVAGDELVIVDINDTSMSPSGTNKKITLAELQAAPLSAGTANGVVFLNGSKVLTSGSALTFNGVTFAENGSPFVVQTDIGTAPNEIPLNQYLGNLAYQDAANIAGNLRAGSINNTPIGATTASTGAFSTLNTSGAVVFNDAGGDVDFRVEGDTNANLLFVDASVDAIGIGTASPNASAILDAQSTTKGVRMPNMTTTQKNAIASPAAGLMVFDTTLAKLCVYSGVAWETITSI